MHPQRYSKILLVAALALLLGVVAINVERDPYDVYKQLWTGAPQPINSPTAWIGKAYQVRAAQPQALIIGNSRAGFSYQASDAAWHGLRAYNYGTPEASLYQMRRQFEHAAAVSPDLEVVLVGLAFEAFADDDTRSNFDDRLAVDPQGAPQHLGWIRDLSSLAISHDTLVRSLGKRADADATKADGDFTGVRSAVPGTPAYETRVSCALQITAKAFGRRHYQHAADGSLTTFAELDHIAQLARERGMHLILVLDAAHVIGLVQMDQLGLRDEWFRWKHDVLARALQYQAQAGADQVEIWDFARLNEATESSFAELGGGRSDSSYFYEPVHFLPSLGSKVLAATVGGQPQAVDGLGARIRSAADWTADDEQAMRHGLDDWEQQNPDATAHVREWGRTPCGARLVADGPHAELADRSN